MQRNCDKHFDFDVFIKISVEKVDYHKKKIDKLIARNTGLNAVNLTNYFSDYFIDICIHLILLFINSD